MNISALIVALYLLVTTRLAGVRLQPAEYMHQKSLALDIVKESVGDDVKLGDVHDADVDQCTKQFRDQHWTQMDWFTNVPVGAGVGDNDFLGESADDGSDDRGIEEGHLLISQRKTGRMRLADRDILQAGLGTMVNL